MGEHGDSACRCGHVEAAHEHYRRGTDCGICGRDACPAFSAAPAETASTQDSRTATAPAESHSA
jgi:hypothetical protein